MKMASKIFLSLLWLLLLAGTGNAYYTYFAFGGLQGSFLSIGLIGLSAVVIFFLLALSIKEIWSKK